MIEESYVLFDTAKLLKEAGFDVPCNSYYELDGGEVVRKDSIGSSDYNAYEDTVCSRPTQALAARWLREAHNIDVMVDVYNRDYYVCNVYKNKHLMIIRNIVTSSFEKALEEGLYEAIKLIKK